MRMHFGSDLYGKASVTDKVSLSDVSKYKKVMYGIVAIVNVILLLLLVADNCILLTARFW